MKTCAKDYILRGLTNNKQDEVNGKKSIQKVRMICNFFLSSAELSMVRDHPFKTSACLRGGGVSPCADGQKVTVHKDQKSPS
jgi:hypothetical protein